MDLEKAYQLIIEKLTTWTHELITLLPNLVLAILILVLGFYIAKWVRKFSYKLICKISKVLTINKLFGSFMYMFTIALVFFAALKVLKLDQALTTALAGAGIIGLALAFAFQDIASNFMSGIFISFRQPIRIGDMVKIDEHIGNVVNITLRDISIRTFQGQTVIVPNKTVFQNSIVNYSYSGLRRVDLVLRVKHTEDLLKVREVAVEAVKKTPYLIGEQGIHFYYEQFTKTAVQVTFRLMLNKTDEPSFLHARSEAIILLQKAFMEHNIEIPFPITTIDFENENTSINFKS